MAQKDPAHSAPSPRFCDSSSCREGTPLSKPPRRPRDCKNNLQEKEATSRSRARPETSPRPGLSGRKWRRLAPPPCPIPRETSQRPPSFFLAADMVGYSFRASSALLAQAASSTCLAPQPRTLHLSPIFWAAYGGLQGGESVWARKPGAACSAQGSDLWNARAQALPWWGLTAPGQSVTQLCWMRHKADPWSSGPRTPHDLASFAPCPQIC